MISEINPKRVEIGRGFGFDVVNPTETDLVDTVDNWTESAGADVVFEVTASKAGAEIMTELVRTRGQIVIVGIFSDPAEVSLFKVLWRELRVRGARVYQSQDFEKAIALADSGELPLDDLISEVYSLERLGEGLEQLTQGGDAMKILIQCTES